MSSLEEKNLSSSSWTMLLDMLVSWNLVMCRKLSNEETGFFYVKNFNISQEEIDNQFALGREFYALPLEEKLKFHSASDLARGEYNSYRPAGHRM